MSATRPPTLRGFTLLEVLIVLAVIGVLAGMMIADTNSSIPSNLEAAASILGRDIEYARNLAVAGADDYSVTFELDENRWVLRHTGMNSALDALPITPLHLAGDPPNEQIVDLDELPGLGGSTRLFAVWSLSEPPQAVNDIKFLPLGETSRAEPTLVWLAAGTGGATRYLSVRIHPTTGLYWVENFRSTMPTPATF